MAAAQTCSGPAPSRHIPLDETVWIHQLSGLLILIGMAGHVTMHVLDFAWNADHGSGQSVAVQLVGTWTGVSGLLITLIFLLMMLTSLPFVRRRKFRWGKRRLGG